MDPSWQPAQPGDRLAAIDTPALLVDLDAFDAHLAALMQAVAAAAAPGQSIRVRPHAKSHKCVAIARQQLALGASGICVQKAAEAEVFIRAGIPDVLITNEVVAPRKLARLAAVAAEHPQARIGLCVDALGGVGALATACTAHRARIDVYVELDVGQDRCGVRTDAQVLALAQAVCRQAGLAFMGLHAYHGAAQHLRTLEERAAAIAQAAERARAARAALLAAGLPCPIVTGAGTGTFMLELSSGVYDEIQPGSYPLMDADYARNAAAADAPRFAQSLFVLAEVISVRDDGGRATLDAGLKSLATDSGPPLADLAGWQVRSLSDEHTVLDRVAGAHALQVGDRVRLIPGHCDPTVNLHDWIVACRGDHVAEVWPVNARGAVF
jgi:D-serine deaminase-like pyridoxal phosphate-dependent protein